MKYVRTDDGIFEVINEEVLCGVHFYDVETGEHLNRIREEHIIAQANAFKELCDGFYVQIDDWHFDLTHLFDNLEKAIEDFEDWQSYSDRKGLEYEIEVYGFIKTPKGLIYVAKMNEEGNLTRYEVLHNRN